MARGTVGWRSAHHVVWVATQGIRTVAFTTIQGSPTGQQLRAEEFGGQRPSRSLGAILSKAGRQTPISACRLPRISLPMMFLQHADKDAPHPKNAGSVSSPEDPE
jgi:hypothetical protein